MSQKAAPKNNDLKVAIWSVVVVVVAIVAIIIVKVANGSGSSTSSGTGLASASLMAKVTGISQATFDKVGQGSASQLPQALPSTATKTTQDGKPEIVFVGAEYCPYCATERWPMVIALSRFGTFHNLGTTTSSSTDVYPSTATFAFHGSTYDSKYIAFTPVEEYTNQPNGQGGYTTLDTPTSAQQALVKTYDAAPYTASSEAGSIPFIYFGGRFLITGSTYSPQVLQGKSQDGIASELNDPSTDISKGAVGAANTITAAICTMTKNQPSNVCSSKTIKQLQSKIGS